MNFTALIGEAMNTAKSRRRWFYCGDMNIEHGGFFYCLQSFEDGWVDVYRVQPCSDAGGPRNVFWFEQLQVNIPGDVWFTFRGVGDTVTARRAHRMLHNDPPATRTEDALVVCGWDAKLPEWDALTQAQARHVIVDAMIAYGHYEQQSSQMVSLGKPEFTRNREGNWKPDKVLRANVNLRTWVRRHCE